MLLSSASLSSSRDFLHKPKPKPFRLSASLTRCPSPHPALAKSPPLLSTRARERLSAQSLSDAPLSDTIEPYRRRKSFTPLISIYTAAFYTGVIGAAITEQLYKDVFDTSNDMPFGNGVLVIADLAGAERDKKTGNMGSRLGESHFINNTSIVFGLCLRSLLEHQRNPKRPLEMHYKNSLMTRYLKEYLEGKKRMTLILTVKPGKDDYVDTSFVLRQEAPYMKIKYDTHLILLLFFGLLSFIPLVYSRRVLE